MTSKTDAQRQREALLEAAESFQDVVALMSGMRSQLVNHGWSDHAAEVAVLALLFRQIPEEDE